MPITLQLLMNIFFHSNKAHIAAILFCHLLGVPLSTYLNSRDRKRFPFKTYSYIFCLMESSFQGLRIEINLYESLS